MNCSPLRRAFLIILLVLACFALLPTGQAVLPSPTPDGGYPNNNTAEGTGALSSLTTGSSNTAIGHAALTNNTSGFSNTATGDEVLFKNTIGNFNTGTGAGCLVENTTGSNNTAIGLSALANNTTGNNNTATGVNALFSNTTVNGVSGHDNTATGNGALSGNTTGTNNTATGMNSLTSNTTGNTNTATGANALFNNTIARDNTANGFNALFSNATGTDNAADGFDALYHSTGSNNVACGSYAGYNLTIGSNNIDLGNLGVAGEANTIRIGNAVATAYPNGTHPAQTKTFIAGIHGATASGGAAVFVNSSGQLGTATCSARFKDAIKPMDKASEVILALKPVTFHYKKEIDPERIPQFGLVAEDVEKVNPDLITRDAGGKPYTVRYEAVNAMLLNEFLKEHRKVEQLTKVFHVTVAQQQKEIADLAATVKEQAAQIQKVSDQLELSKPAAQTVANNQ